MGNESPCVYPPNYGSNDREPLHPTAPPPPYDVSIGRIREKNDQKMIKIILKKFRKSIRIYVPVRA